MIINKSYCFDEIFIIHTFHDKTLYIMILSYIYYEILSVQKRSLSEIFISHAHCEGHYFKSLKNGKGSFFDTGNPIFS